MLGLDGDEVLALGACVELGRALDGQIVRFGRAGGPDDFLRVSIDQLGDLLACFFDGLFRLPAEGVRARGGVAEFLDTGRESSSPPRADRPGWSPNNPGRWGVSCIVSRFEWLIQWVVRQPPRSIPSGVRPYLQGIAKIVDILSRIARAKADPHRAARHFRRHTHRPQARATAPAWRSSRRRRSPPQSRRDPACRPAFRRRYRARQNKSYSADARRRAENPCRPAPSARFPAGRARPSGAAAVRQRAAPQVRRHAETDDGRHVFRARAQAALMAAAGNQRLQFDPLVEHQRRRALRAVESCAPKASWHARRPHSARGNRAASLPSACTASVWNQPPQALAAAASAGISCTTPVSLLASITDSSCGRAATLRRSQRNQPSLRHRPQQSCAPASHCLPTALPA